MSSQSVDNPMKDYDVFLSFRGIDTRTGFTSYLYYALQRENYRVFIDDEELERGTPIKEALPEAIEKSHSSIPIISENYASSTACLKELAKIVECNKSWGQIVIPVFYRVEPSHVKNLQIPSYKKEFVKYSKNPKYEFEEVQDWKDALATVCGLAGWAIDELDNEGQMIQRIIAKLQKRLHVLNQSQNDGSSSQSSLPDVADVDHSLEIMKLNENLKTSSNDKIVEDSLPIMESKNIATTSTPSTHTLTKVVKVILPPGDLRHVKELDLSKQNLSNKAFPDDFDCLVSLEELSLGNNPFTALPQNIKALSKLKILRLDYCDRLKRLGPELPSSLESVDVNHCISLESFLDPRVPTDLYCSAVCVECHKLVEKQGSTKTALTALKTYLKNPNYNGYFFHIILPGNEIPEWFTEQSSGPLVSKKLNGGWYIGVQGFALAVCFKAESSDKLYCDMKVDNEKADVTFRIKHHGAVTSQHLCLLFLSATHDFTPIMEKWRHSLGNLMALFHGENNRPVCVTSCGLRLVYKKDIDIYNQTVYRKNDKHASHSLFKMFK